LTHYQVGDNDWNDCPNNEQAWSYWMNHLYQFEGKNWPLLNHTFSIQRQMSHLEDFAFVHKGTLFIGLNLVGGSIRSQMEWNERLTDEVEWTKSLILEYQSTMYMNSNGTTMGHRILLFGHCDPRSDHDPFFIPLRDFIETQLLNSIPIVYIHGDKHEWVYEPLFLGQKSALRISVTGLAKEPPLKMTITADNELQSVSDVFKYDRQLN
jgi:hypothetical protein